MTPREVRDAIYESLSDISGLNVYKYPPDTVQVPAAVVTGFSHDIVDFDQHRNATITITVLVSHQHTSQMELLDQLCDVSVAQSVPGVMLADTDLPLNPRSVGEFGFREWGGTMFYGAAVEAEVLF